MTTVHTFPVNDLVEHSTDSDECICGPDVEYVENGRELVKHHSLDGREHREPDHDRANCPSPFCAGNTPAPGA